MAATRPLGAGIAALVALLVTTWPTTEVSAAAGSAGALAPAVFGARPEYTGRSSLVGGHYTYSLPRGGRVADGIELFNLSPNIITLHVYAANSAVLPGGQLVAGQASSAPPASWIRFSRPTVTLLPHRSTVDTFSLAVPANTPSGDYLSSVVAAYGDLAPTGNGLISQTRAALGVHLRVLGVTHQGLSLGPLVDHRQGPRQMFSLQVTNRGNVLEQLDGRVTVTGAQHAQVALRPAGVYVLPGGQATLQGVVTTAPLFGRLRAQAVIRASDGADPAQTYRSSALYLWLVPWWRIGLSGAALVMMIAVAWLGRGRIRAATAAVRDYGEVLLNHRATRRSSRPGGEAPGGGR